MSIFEDDDINDLLDVNLHNDEDQLPEEVEDNDQVFGSSEQPDVPPIKVQPKKRSVLNPRPRLNVEVLTGQRGLHTIENYFKDIKFKGKGKEKEDIDEVIRRLQHWGHRMYPTYKFDDVLTNIERLGKKKPLQVYMSRYRLGMLDSMKNQVEVNEDDDEEQTAATNEPYDEFDALLDEQIAISKVDPRTPGSSVYSNNLTTPSFSGEVAVSSTPYTGLAELNDTSDFAVPLPPSQPSTPVPKQQLNAEQMARIAENRRLALERLANKKRLLHEAQNKSESFKT